MIRLWFIGKGYEFNKLSFFQLKLKRILPETFGRVRSFQADSVSEVVL